MAEDDSFEVSYERSEIIRHSMIPLIDDAVEEFHKLFSEAKKKTICTNNIWKKQSKNDDYKIDAILHMEMKNFEDHDLDSLKEMLQSFCDQANIAKRESALNAERNVNLQTRLSSTEISNARLTKIVEEMETKIFNLLQKLNKEESTRISLMREYKEINEKFGNDKKKIESELGHLQDRLRHVESESLTLQTKLTESLQRENASNSALIKAQNLVDDLKAELENERIKSQTRIEKIERDGKRVYGEKEHALQKQINSMKNEISGLHEEYSKTLESHQKAAKEAIARLSKDIEELDASRMKYYNQYKALLEDLNDHKRKISHEILKQAILKLTQEYRNDQIKTSQIRKGLQATDLHGISNFGERCLDMLKSPPNTSSSEGGIYRSHRNENQPPLPSSSAAAAPPPTRYRNSGVRETAQRYDIRGHFDGNTRH
uniref:Uncharacterized protein n=1 Tax=Panagrolaimus superbus TaxID=310955 RepID=A0A914YQ72_9BILA